MAAAKKRVARRRKPIQARSQETVDAILEGAARVFRREGWKATTNRIAREAGVSVGSLYEYFPNKRALLTALATRHVELAEHGVEAALSAKLPTRELATAIQAAILESQRFPSHALVLVRDVPSVGPELAARAAMLERRAVAALCDRARKAGLPEPALRAQAAFGALGRLTVQTMLSAPDELDGMARHLLEMALGHLTP